MAQSFKLNFQTGNVPQAPSVSRHNLFATQIWQARLAPAAGELAEWNDEVHRLRAADPQPAGRTNRAGWNSRDSNVLDGPVFASLGAAIRRLAGEAIAEMAGEPVPFTLQSWVNLHDRGGFNFLHLHDNVLLSGSFYLQVPEGSGDLVFRDPRAGVLTSRFKGNGPNACKEVRLTPSAGLLVMFPHWLEHYVEPHGSDQPRIAIAFNALAG